MTIAYIAQGKLFLKRGELAPLPVESPFALGILERASREQHRNAWKQKPAGQAGMSQSNFLWNLSGGAALDPGARKINFGGVVSTGPDELLYTLETDATCGLFTFNTTQNDERRLVHRKDFRAIDLARHLVGGQIACSITKPDGTAHLGVMDSGGGRLREVTEGDAVDQAPSWVPNEKETLIYQSAGLARNQHGIAYAIGPYAIFKLDLAAGKMSTLLEDSKTDYLLPRIGPDGAMYFIRRPYEALHAASPWQGLKDVLLFPYRLLLAVLGFLNFFSMVFNNQPLTHAGGPKMEPTDSRYMMFYGKMIDAERAMKGRRPDEIASLVPDQWELVKSSTDGKFTVLAKGVLSYDVGSDGQVVYTNGSTVFRIDDLGKPVRICSGKFIERVVLC